MSRTQRQRRIVELLGAHAVHSQGELSDLLVAEGTEVTQATLSRDLVELGAVQVRRGRALVYAVPGEGLLVGVGKADLTRGCRRLLLLEPERTARQAA